MSEETIRVFRTDQLNVWQWESYIRNFNKVFRKNFTIEIFKKKYCGTCLGFSFHGALINMDGDIVGMYSAIPRKYSFSGRDEIVAQGCDAFVLEEYRRDELVLKYISEAVISYLHKLGIYYHISLPNPTAYPYWKFFCGWQDIMKLNYYIIPLRTGNILSKWKFINVFSCIFFKSAAILDMLIYKSQKPEIRKISLKIDPSFLEHRYDESYTIRNEREGFVYKGYDEDGMKAVYLIDCFEKSLINMSRAFRYILFDKNYKPDIIIYIGRTKSIPWYMLKVPYNKEPRHQPFIGLCTNPEYKDYFHIPENWDISLANFDNR